MQEQGGGLSMKMFGGGPSLSCSVIEFRPMSNLTNAMRFIRDPTMDGVNSLTAIGGHDRQYFNELCARMVSPRIFVLSQSLIAR